MNEWATKSILELRREDGLTAEAIQELWDENGSTISVACGANGTISPSGEIKVPVGESKTFAIEPNTAYRISEVLVDGASVGAVSSYTFENVTENHTIAVSFVEVPIYNYQISMSTSSPSSSVTFSGASLPLGPTGRKTWTYNKVKPTVVKNGTIVYDLKRDNLALKSDGVTASDLTGTDGDVCASFSRLWFKYTPMAGQILDVKICEYAQAGYTCFHNLGGRARLWNHLGMFEATGTTCDSVYSATTTPTVSQSLKTFRTQAQTKNVGLDEALYGPMTYLSLVMYQTLFVHAYGTLDAQAAVGNGNTGTSAAIAVGRAELLAASGEYGSKVTSDTHVMALYVVNPWGNVWKFTDGCMWSGGSFGIQTDQADLFDIELGWANKPVTWHTFETGIGTAVSGSYVTAFGGDPYAPFFASSVTGGSSGTYACDAIWTSTGDRVCLVGGGWNNSANAGVFCAHANYSVGLSYSYLGARLQILDAA